MDQMVKHKRGISYYIFKMDKLDVKAMEGFMNRTKDPKQINEESYIPLNYKNINDNQLKDYLDKCVPHFRKYSRKRENIRNIRQKRGLCKLCTNNKFIFKHYKSWSDHFYHMHKKAYKENKKQQCIPKSFYFDVID